MIFRQSFFLLLSGAAMIALSLSTACGSGSGTGGNGGSGGASSKCPAPFDGTSAEGQSCASYEAGLACNDSMQAGIQCTCTDQNGSQVWRCLALGAGGGNGTGGTDGGH